MRYLVKARVKPGREAALRRAIQEGTLGAGSVAGDEYAHNMTQARLAADGTARWVEVCFCAIPLEEERPYGKPILIFSRSKMPMPAGTAGIWMVLSPGRAATAAARGGLKSDLAWPVNRFSRNS